MPAVTALRCVQGGARGNRLAAIRSNRAGQHAGLLLASRFASHTCRGSDKSAFLPGRQPSRGWGSVCMPSRCVSLEGASHRATVAGLRDSLL